MTQEATAKPRQFGKPFWVGVAVVAILAAAEIAFSSPLFAVLGFEYSALMGLAMSAVCGIVVIYALPSGPRGFARSIFAAAILSLALAIVPLLVSILSLAIIPNCSLSDGALFYLEIALPSALLGGLFGLGFRLLLNSRKAALWCLIIFWIVSLVVSLLAGYYNPQLFTYGWQYGFFPGFVWDEAMELSNAYLFARIEHFVWAMLLLCVAQIRFATRRVYFVIAGSVILIAAVFLFAGHDRAGVTVSHSAVTKDLSAALRIDRTCVVHYAPLSLTPDEIDKLRGDLLWYLHDIRRRFELKDSISPITIYIYPSTESFYTHVGSRVASIAKPWLGELHIAKGNLGSLKHELTHVLLREKGSFPFYASWSTGLTEGAAMSVEPEYDGIYTVDEHAARILQLGYGGGIRQIMSFAGFASGASTTSYVLAGSFSRYLLSTYGAARFDRVYSSLDFKQEYAKPLETLEAEWKRWLAPLAATPLDVGDSEHFRYYYDRASIIFSPCLRRIGKLQRRGAEAYAEKRFRESADFYRQAVAEGAGNSALAWEASAILRTGRIDAALAVLDTEHSVQILRQKAALDLERASLHAIRGDLDTADELYRHAMNAKISASIFLAAYADDALLRSDIRDDWVDYLREFYQGSRTDEKALAILDRMQLDHSPQSGFDRVNVAVQILRLTLLTELGELRVARSIDSNAIVPREPVLPEDSLALCLLAVQLRKLGVQPSVQEISPAKYSRATQEVSNELTEKERFLESGSLPRGRETYP